MRLYQIILTPGKEPVWVPKLPAALTYDGGYSEARLTWLVKEPDGLVRGLSQEEMEDLLSIARFARSVKTLPSSPISA